MKAQDNRCERCGKVQEGNLTFAIGASNRPDWRVCEGTGRFVCPDCYKLEQVICEKLINKKAVK